MALLYTALRPILHQLDPEKAHELSIRALAMGMVPGTGRVEDASIKQELFGLTFDNPVGLAAGFDKNAQAVAGLTNQGFGFLEVGTVTPKPQDGNPTPRIFRLKQDQAVINRLGFNNEGADKMKQRLTKLNKKTTVIGVNIGRNKECTDPIADYQSLVTQMYEVADYITINVSSPNTQGLRDMQQKRKLHELLSATCTTRDEHHSHTKRLLPLLLKISPDIDEETKESIAELAIQFKLDGLIVSNTTIKRPNTLKSSQHSKIGGLSGKPLMQTSTAMLGDMFKLTQNQIPLIGVGGISSPEDAYQKILHGASLIQLYTAFVYQGFGLVRSINKGLVERLQKDNYTHISEAVGQAIN